MISEFFKSKIFYKNLALSVALFIVIILFTTIVLNLYTRHGSEKPLPSFVGMDVSGIEELMDELDFQYEITDSVFDINMKPGRIYDQHPIAGSLVKSDRKIRFSIYSSTPIMAVVPDVTDQSVRNAQGELLECGFVIGKISYVTSEYTNLVLSQEYKGKVVQAGIKLPKGCLIDLVVGKSGSAERTKVPDLLGLTYLESNNYLKDALLNMGSAAYDNSVITSSDSIKAIVYKQNPASDDGTTISLGSSVNVWLTIDYSKLTQ